MSEEKQKVDPIVAEVETEYPEMTKEFKRILRFEYELFCKKTANYGTTNIALGTNLEKDEDKKFSQMGIFFRMNDKVQRLKNLLLNGKKDEVGESITDTYQDLSVYAIIAQIVKNGKWGK